VGAVAKWETGTWEGMMKKLTLNLDALKVEQFETTERNQSSRGTVVANMTGPDDCVTITCGDSVRVSCELLF
jgi:hypothetical protein